MQPELEAVAGNSRSAIIDLNHSRCCYSKVLLVGECGAVHAMVFGRLACQWHGGSMAAWPLMVWWWSAQAPAAYRLSPVFNTSDTNQQELMTEIVWVWIVCGGHGLLVRQRCLAKVCSGACGVSSNSTGVLACGACRFQGRRALQAPFSCPTRPSDQASLRRPHPLSCQLIASCRLGCAA